MVPRMTFKSLLNSGRRQSASLNTALVVDSDRSFLQVLKRYLTRYNFRLLSASNTVESFQIATLHAKELSLTISDLYIPDFRSGIEFVKLVRITPNLSELPILMLSYDDRPQALLTATMAGATAFYLKQEDSRSPDCPLKRPVSRQTHRRIQI